MATPARSPIGAPDQSADPYARLLAEILAELRAIRAAIAAERTPGREPDPRHVALIEALADAIGPYDLDFSASEVLDAARSDYALDTALAACGATDAGALGVLFRSLRGRDIGGYRLVRDGRAWRLERCT